MLAVVAFHAFPDRLAGGFAGVDVFFVISGFLITGLISQEIDAGAFSFARFYARRARRIFPALCVVLLATLAIGWVMLLPDEFSRLGEHVMAGAFFSSNLVLWHEVGYFDASAATKPLLHLWSLGVEEQFYLAWPIVLMVIWRFRGRRTLLIGLVGFVSFAINVAIIHRAPSAAFYSPFARAWELMIGALLSMVRIERATPSDHRIAREVASLGGGALLVASFATLNARMAFPGWYAMLPTLGTALVIAAGPVAWLNRRLLSHRAVVFVGLISYPLYLWHWPLLVYLRLGLESFALTPHRIDELTAVTVAIAVTLAALTFHFIELPVRRSTQLTTTALRSAAVLAATAIVGVVLWQQPHVRLGDDPRVIRAVDARSDWLVADIDQGVRYASGQTGDPDVVFIGDSQGERYFPAVQHAAAAMTPRPVVVFATKRACAFLPWLGDAACIERYRSSLRLAMRASVQRVVIVCAWSRYVNARFGRLRAGSTILMRPDGVMATPAEVDSAFRLLAADITALTTRGKEVVIILSPPASPLADPALLANGSRVPFLHAASNGAQFAASFPLAPFELETQWMHGELAMVAQRSGARTIDPSRFLCANAVCITQDERGTPIRSDASHLRAFASIRYLTFVPSLITVRR